MSATPGDRLSKALQTWSALLEDYLGNPAPSKAARLRKLSMSIRRLVARIRPRRR